MPFRPELRNVMNYNVFCFWDFRNTSLLRVRNVHELNLRFYWIRNVMHSCLCLWYQVLIQADSRPASNFVLQCCTASNSLGSANSPKRMHLTFASVVDGLHCWTACYVIWLQLYWLPACQCVLQCCAACYFNWFGWQSRTASFGFWASSGPLAC